jgi:uncharacterized protein with PIN domain
MILNRKLYKEVNIVRYALRSLRNTTHNLMRLIFRYEVPKAIEYPKEQFIYSQRNRVKGDVKKCEECNETLTEFELIIGGNTFNKAHIYECLACHKFFPGENKD